MSNQHKHTDHQRFLMAQDLYNGGTIKQVAYKWKVNKGYLYAIFDEYLEWKIVWKTGEKYKGRMRCKPYGS